MFDYCGCPLELRDCSTWVDLLQRRSQHHAEQIVFTFLQQEGEPDRLNYQQFDQRSRAIAAHLQSMGLAGERALLLYPPGLEFLTAFFGCLYAGVVAVTAYPPHNQRNTPRILAVIDDAQAAIALTTTTIQPRVQSLLTEKTDLCNLQWLTTDDILIEQATGWIPPAIDGDSLAFLQYTSGSTGKPKGVMLSHANLLHNAAVTYLVMEHSPESVFVSWLPTYHDMGLIGGILQPLYGGFPGVLMAPASFLQRPYRWLKAISDYRGTTSGAPNFAYELCVQKVTPEQRVTLDLSSWQVAFNGAEPVRAETLERFSESFSTCGFRSTAFYPCYGMAEASLIISGGRVSESPPLQQVRQSTLERGHRIESATDTADQQVLVGCGQTMPDQTVAIANPDTLKRCSPGEVGEIWVAGPSIGHGYWNRPEETQQTFHAYLADTGEGPFLRTGDLGVLLNDELFITGRAKDLIIIRGRNLYPQDLEHTAATSHPALRANSSAAFSVEVDGEEQLVIVQELEFRQRPNLDAVMAAIRRAIADTHAIQVYAVLLIKPGTIPKTSSGKIQRRACRAQFLAGELTVLGRSVLEQYPTEQRQSEPSAIAPQREELLSISPREGQQRLTAYLLLQVTQVLRISVAHLNPDQSLSAVGLDSLRAFELKSQIEADLDLAISVTDLFAGLSLTQFATKLLAELAASKPTHASRIAKQTSQTDVHPLTASQQQIWFLSQLEDGNAAYNIAFAIHLDGALNQEWLEHSLNTILQRHETLRTNVAIVHGQPVQIISPTGNLTLPVIDGQAIPEALRASEVQRLAVQVCDRPFNLKQDSLFRTRLIRLTPTAHVLVLVMHHLIADGGSAELFLREMAVLYHAYAVGKDTSTVLPELSIQYRDYVHWQQQWLQGDNLSTQLAYWKKQLADASPVLALPTDHPRPAVQTYRGRARSLALTPTLTASLKQLADQSGVTLFMLLLAAFQTLLLRYTGQSDISVGSPISGRYRLELKPLIGFFVNTLVLRTDVSGNPTFQDLLHRVRCTALEAYAHPDVAFSQLVEALQPPRNAGYNPLFQVSFALQDAPTVESIPGLSLKVSRIYGQTAQFDLSVTVEATAQNLTVVFEYNTDLFEATTISRLQEHFVTLLDGIVAHPEQRLSDLPLLTAAERQLLMEWNATQTDDVPDRPIHLWIEAQVKQTPDAIALVFQDQQLTYWELNDRANQLAHELHSHGVGPEVLVGLCLERSPEIVIGLLGVLKAGGAYVPLDPSYPSERLAFMLQDANVSVLLTQHHLQDRLPLKTTTIYLDQDWPVIAQNSTDNPICQTHPNDLAYVIYTSGSTGIPKGVMIQHQSLTTYIQSACAQYELTSRDRILQFASLSFDAAIEEMYTCLTCGGTLVLRNDAVLSSVPTFLQHCDRWEITVLDLPTAYWHLLCTELAATGLGVPSSVRVVIIGGERVLPDRVHLWHHQVKAAPPLVNTYGPTEATVVAILTPVPMSTSLETLPLSIPIGRALPHIQTYVLDSQQQPVPIGVPGELYLGGVGLARGYLNAPERTAVSFLPNPFTSVAGSRLYRTGDRVRYRQDGQLEYLGRVDEQVKVRGFRIELGELEAVLVQCPGVQEAIASVQPDPSGSSRLVAYVVLQEPLDDWRSHVKSFLSARLPDYMLPTAFIRLDTLPLTPSGKRDRKGLPTPDFREISGSAYVPPQTEIEQAIATIWQAVLNVDSVGIHDNFFDMGGHSLLMSRVNGLLQERLNHELSIVELFQYPTIHLLSQHLSQQIQSPQQHQQSTLDQIRQRAERQRAALSQHRHRQ